MMTSINRITRIKGLGVFRDFSWPQDLPEFGRRNLIYGWNWSGKTLISRLFAAMEKGIKPPGEEIRLQLSGGEEARGEDFERTSQLLKVRVFNRDFINENVFSPQEAIRHIFVLGEKSIERQKELEALVNEIGMKERDLDEKRRQKQRIQKETDNFCTDSARIVRESLRSEGPDRYANYERPEFCRSADNIPEGVEAQLILNATEYDRLLKLIRAEQRSALETVYFSFGSSTGLFEKGRTLCASSVVAKTIADLTLLPELNTWVQTGLNLHRKYGTETCLFCNQKLPQMRLQALEAHFSEQYTQLVQDIEQCLREMNEAERKLERLTLPDESRFYPDLLQRYTEVRDLFIKERDQFLGAVKNLREILEDKKSNPFQMYWYQFPDGSISDKAIEEINKVITDHNKKIENYESDVQREKERIERSIVAEKLPQYRQLKKAIRNSEQQITALEAEINKMKTQQDKLEFSLVEHHRPAEELNGNLAAYLGHGEIRFEDLDTGYRIVRNGEAAEWLSEGERTAIALLYFLKSLEDVDFKIENGIVVVDDPVSSLDGNALYRATAFLRYRLDSASQLFILTHNFAFFREVKQWFKGKKDRHYMLIVGLDKGKRYSRLANLDSFLSEYDTEYHYLFKLVYGIAKMAGFPKSLEQCIPLPNLTRRLLESFLEFKCPGNKELTLKIRDVTYDENSKIRIERFCHSFSHRKTIGAAEEDPSFLCEAAGVAKDVMGLIEELDKKHYDAMVRLIEESEENH